MPVTSKGIVISYEKAYDLFAHTSKDMTMSIAKHPSLQIGVKNKNTCEYYTIGKAKQRDIPKKSEYIRSKITGER